MAMPRKGEIDIINRKGLWGEMLQVRPRKGEEEAAWSRLKDWCEKHQVPISCIFNALFIPITYAIENFTHQVDDHNLACVMNFGEVNILIHKPRQGTGKNNNNYKMRHIGL